MCVCECVCEGIQPEEIILGLSNTDNLHFHRIRDPQLLNWR